MHPAILFTALLFLFNIAALPKCAEATNGMNMIGYGAVSSGMGGADLALVDNATAMNINPAGLTGCCTPQISAGLSFMQARNQHKDTHGNDLQAKDQIFSVPLLAWAQPLHNTSFIAGIGFFAQGGMGVKYSHFRLPFADQVDMQNEYDTISSDVRYMKVTPTLAWQSSDASLRLGASLNFGYAETQMRLFPHTSIMESQFYGIEMKGCEAYSAAFRLGFQYKIGYLTLGGAYLSGTDHKFDNGSAKINYTAIEHGIVRYDAELDGFNWPSQIGLGLSYQITRNLKIAFDVDWINWSGAIDNITFNLKQSSNPEVPGNISMGYPMHWNNQWVYAFGFEYNVSSVWSIRGGYNYAKSPVPAQHLLPYFPAIAEHHITGGISYSTHNWSVDLACEWAIESSVSSNNSLYCSHGFSEEMSQITTHFMLSYKL